MKYKGPEATMENFVFLLKRSFEEPVDKSTDSQNWRKGESYKLA
jgi:hypothetical protein